MTDSISSGSRRTTMGRDAEDGSRKRVDAFTQAILAGGDATIDATCKCGRDYTFCQGARILCPCGLEISMCSDGYVRAKDQT
jgi:hypothetical protein